MPKIPPEFGQLPLNFESSDFASLHSFNEPSCDVNCKVVSMQEFRKRVSSESSSLEDRKRAALLEILEDAKRLTW